MFYELTAQSRLGYKFHFNFLSNKGFEVLFDDGLVTIMGDGQDFYRITKVVGACGNFGF